MCAIYGIAGQNNIDLLKIMSKSQIHRGPDSQNFYENAEDNFCFGTNRLAVIDKALGSQPMISSNQKFITIFNGAIYNFLDLKKHLLSKNITFKTNSDTEVLVNSYEYWGDKAFNYFDGMWACCIYDIKKKTLILSRDYLGQKPLFYYINNNKFIFSSQLNGILNIDKNIELNKYNLKKYFSFSHTPAPNTIYKNIYQLIPGEIIKVKLNNLELEKKIFWDLVDGPDYNIFFKKNTINQIQSNFSQIVYQHSIADKKIGILLSGGKDSSIVKKKLENHYDNLTSYTLGFENNTYDESKYIDRKSSKFENIIKIISNNEIKTNFDKIISKFDYPFGDSSILPTYTLFNEIKKDTNVAITGDGGDENFFGYITFDAFYLAINLKKFLPGFLFTYISKIFDKFYRDNNKYLPTSKKIKLFFKFLNEDLKILNLRWLSNLYDHELNELTGSNQKNILNEYPEITELFEKSENLMRFCQLYYFKFYLPNILTKVDMSSMLNSVESRAPFLSKNILNLSAEVSVHDNFKLFRQKNLLIKIFKSDLSTEQINRKKHGFAFQKDIILKDPNFIDKFMDKSLLSNKDFFKTKYKKYLDQKEDYSQYLWNELILNICLQNKAKN